MDNVYLCFCHGIVYSALFCIRFSRHEGYYSWGELCIPSASEYLELEQQADGAIVGRPLSHICNVFPQTRLRATPKKIVDAEVRNTIPPVAIFQKYGIPVPAYDRLLSPPKESKTQGKAQKQLTQAETNAQASAYANAQAQAMLQQAQTCMANIFVFLPFFFFFS
jgi:hypothetical protein